jgi:hypothetical protein
METVGFCNRFVDGEEMMDLRFRMRALATNSDGVHATLADNHSE